ncbi:MAG: RNA polymerase sigma factor [Nitrospirae bacterium]|nr:RNA polymerase sigma factor [Nitrospirota bacterium]
MDACFYDLAATVSILFSVDPRINEISGRFAESDDASLINATLSGDDDAFTELVKRYKHKVFGIAVRFAGDAHELDDICQEVFIKAYQNLGKFRGDAPFEHWISRIAVRNCYDALRKRKQMEYDFSFGSLDLPIIDNSSQKSRLAERKYKQLYAALEKLSPKDKMVIVLLELEEKTVREVAALTGWSETNVKVRAFRARWRLRKYLEKKDET